MGSTATPAPEQHVLWGGISAAFCQESTGQQHCHTGNAASHERGSFLSLRNPENEAVGSNGVVQLAAMALQLR